MDKKAAISFFFMFLGFIAFWLLIFHQKKQDK